MKDRVAEMKLLNFPIEKNPVNNLKGFQGKINISKTACSEVDESIS